ncbi:inverse autotransporter beta domain-containing protein [Salmonella enterica]|nr:inverse autotransporter beta domain-containing protein [Salmonella enterica]
MAITHINSRKNNHEYDSAFLSLLSRNQLDRIYSWTAWVNVFVQCAFPVALAITPVMTANADSAELNIRNVNVYILKKGETVSDVAGNYHLSVSELKKINQFRTFAVPFERLSGGDEIDIPFTEDKAEYKNSDKPESASPEQNKEIERWLASNASGAASAMSGRHRTTPGDYAGSRARSALVSGGEAAVSKWLSQFGTVKVQLGINNEDLSLTESSLDMLVPLYDDGDMLWFTQTGGRYRDKRTTLNLGTGVRVFSGKWMYGVNTFFDDDITGHNRRLGAGAELWTDYLKFSGNVYYRLTDWHQSRDFDDYDERPANGFDATISGWLPAYPQLGGKLKYEQYYGDEVALIDKDTRQHNPQAITAGIEYTPVPLVTIGTDYRKSGGHDDNQFNVQFKWTPGRSFSEQLSPDAVASERTLAGSRLDLVERNNNIVLEYKKQEVIRLTIPEFIHGPGGSQQIFSAVVTGKYGLDQIKWQTSSAFTSAGGEIQIPSVAGVYQMKMPAWQANGTNQYEVTGVAWDIKGNASKPVRMQINVDRPGVDASKSQIQLDSQDVLPADGKTTRKIILKANDSNGLPVTGIAPLIHFSGSFVTTGSGTKNSTPGVTAMLGRATRTVSEFVFSPAYAETTPAEKMGGCIVGVFTEKAPGIYEATLTTGKVTGELTLMFEADSVKLRPLKITLGEVVYTLDSARLLTLHPVSDGLTTPEELISVKDKDGQPVRNEVFTITVNAISETVKTDGNGDAIIKLPTQTVPGDYQFEFKSGKSSITTLITYETGVANNSNSMLSVNTNEILADDKTKGTLTLVLKDKLGNPLKGKNVSFIPTPSGIASVDSVTDHGDGTYTADIHGGSPGEISVSALVEKFPAPVSSVKLTLIQSVLKIMKNGSDLQGNPNVGDTLSVKVECTNGVAVNLCKQTAPNGYQWEVETSVGSDTWIAIAGEVSEQYVVTRDIQKRRLRVSEK